MRNIETCDTSHRACGSMHSECCIRSPNARPVTSVTGSVAPYIVKNMIKTSKIRIPQAPPHSAILSNDPSAAGVTRADKKIRDRKIPRRLAGKFMAGRLTGDKGNGWLLAIFGRAPSITPPLLKSFCPPSPPGLRTLIGAERRCSALHVCLRLENLNSRTIAESRNVYLR